MTVAGQSSGPGHTLTKGTFLILEEGIDFYDQGGGDDPNKIIMVLPRKTTGAAYAEKIGGLFLQIIPGTDAILHVALVRYILENGWEDKEFIEKWIANRWEIDSGFGRGIQTPVRYRSRFAEPQEYLEYAGYYADPRVPGGIVGTRRLHDPELDLGEPEGPTVHMKWLSAFKTQSGKALLHKTPWDLFGDFYERIHPKEDELWVSKGRVRKIGESPYKHPLTSSHSESKNVGRALLPVDRRLTDRSVRPT